MATTRVARRTSSVARRKSGRPENVEARFAPLEAKLSAPPLRPGLVTRDALVERLEASDSAPVVCVTAPPGYGKTTVLAQWSWADRRPFGWVSLDETDNDPVELLTYVAIALNRMQPLGGPVFAALSARNPGVETVVLPRLSNAVARISEPFVLVLDDAHVLTSERSLAAVLVLLRHVPEGSQLVLATRSELALPIGRLRAQRALFELGSADLAFDVDAAEALLRAAGIALGRRSVRRITEQTEGWPAGLYLAALSLRGQGTVVAAEGAFAGDDRLVDDYFQDEVLARLSPDLARFLTRTSLLERLSGSLCDAVLLGSGSAARLRRLERSNLFLIPLDRRRAWYRYHNLFAEMLRGTLREEEPELELELHRRASAWYAEHGELDEAVRHAQEAGDVALVGDLIWSHVSAQRRRGRGIPERWLARCTDEEVAACPSLALAAAWCAVGRNDGAAVEQWTEAAACGSHEGPLSDGATLESAVALLRALVARAGVARMAEDAALVRALEPAGNPSHTRACFLGGVAARLSGDQERARELLERSEGIAAANGLDTIHALSLAQLALLETHRGAWDLASSLVARAEAETDDLGLHAHHMAASVFAVSTLVQAHWGRVQEARRELERTKQLLAETVGLPSWFPVEVRLLLARASLLLAEPTGARKLLAEARAWMAPSVDLGSLRDDFDELTRTAGAYPVTGVTGPSALTLAEMRLLGYLPTHLSFQEIGRHLHISRNTVKSQAISIYRKLEVSSRSAAVARAEACGLIQR